MKGRSPEPGLRLSKRCRGSYDRAIAHKQTPIGTGFGAASTADDVLRGGDLTGKNVVVTGGHAGLGWETTLVRQ